MAVRHADSSIRSTLWPRELDIILELGHWTTPDEVISDALDRLLDAYPDLRRAVAVELFCQDQVSLSRAAEIAEVDIWTFKEILAADGIQITVEANTTAELDEMISQFKQAD
jgi:predicted HTH domain antitoxin